MNSPIECPKCGSTQIRAQQRGFNEDTASIAVTDEEEINHLPSNNNIENHCLTCGHRWKPVNEFNAGFEEQIETDFFDEQQVQAQFYEDYESGRFDKARLRVPASVNDLYKKRGLNAAYRYLKSLDKGSEKFKSKLLAGGLAILLVIIVLVVRSCG
ncbi:hypothetical protein [Spirosoma agri]|uniref:Uncharacterized protein n=1 Tax=Spirosoma agri TaxID=1987381 RepID=A0A6M0IMM8_9BACT|nr:hypothetical protein [Spirosoma agri]NEU69549.1 hypothetical protein [Spirosoma agri]